ncbi:MAG: hypothetical protein JST90_17295 [Bacteroidetes bacterium]|nr:hypothetical protein [Bacteroidota bacterium]
MISIRYPFIVKAFKNLSYGLIPINLPNEVHPVLIIKATKEVILTARNNNEFKIYLIKDFKDPNKYLGFVTAFFDDEDEPLVIRTPLFADDSFVTDIMAVLSHPEFDLYFFDEHHRELMGVKAVNKDYARISQSIDSSKLHKFNQSEMLSFLERIHEGFGIRNEVDDENAFTIKLGERLYPDDFVHMDLTNISHDIEEAKKSIIVTSLERDSDPGPMQERDIALLMGRVFEKQSIFLNPFRPDTEREITDILIVGDKTMLFIQAKDSPNTDDMLRRSIERKKATIRSHIQKATNQIRGAINYVQENKGVMIKNRAGIKTIPLDGRQIVGLIIVKEMFDDDYLECSVPILKEIRTLELPIALLDYSQLHVISQNLKDETSFINGLYTLVDVALQHGRFPKSVWTGRPSDSIDEK